MASLFYNEFWEQLMMGALDLHTAGDTIDVQLHTSTYSEDKDDEVGDLTNEVANGNGYTTGGETLANQVVAQDDANDRANWDADDVSWTSSSITAAGAVIVDRTPATDRLILFVDFGGDVVSSNGTFSITWHSDGIAYLAQAA